MGGQAADDATRRARLLTGLVRDVPDFPIAGILFRDITPILGDAAGFHAAVTALAEQVPAACTHIASIEARGFVLGAALAHALGKAFVPVRKAGKLPSAKFGEEYGLEYGKGVLEIHSDSVPAGARVWLIDDLLATGGTLVAACRLVERVGGVIAKVSVLIELDGLDGWAALRPYEHSSVLSLPAGGDG